MSLNREERERTSRDLREQQDLAGADDDVLARRLGWTPDRLAAAFQVSGDPVDVWLLRDSLDQDVKARGETPSWSVLTDASRRSAERWFDLQDPPTS